MPHPSLHRRSLDEVSRRVGSLTQVARVERLVEEDGPGRGSRRVRLVTGGGLEVDIHPDRGLDLGQVTYHGTPLAWISATGRSPAPPASAERHSFGGGLLTTALTTAPLTAAAPLTTAAPAALTRTEIAGDTLIVAGVVHRPADSLVLERTLTADLGGTTLRLRDTVRNEGPVDLSYLIRYHVSVGWPLLDECAHLDIPSREVVPRDSDARSGVGRWHQTEAPQADYREQVFGHDFRDRGTARVAVDNPEADIRLEVHFDTATLPILHQWKLSGAGHYVMGLEPGNANPVAGAPPVLGPGRSVSHSLDLVLSPSTEPRH